VTRAIPFTIDGIDRGTGARAGRLEMGRGVIHTPVFMPVGTQAALRSLPPTYATDLGIEIILANTYHLHQRPGEAIVQKMGGLHRFMGAPMPILTDSGGFQVFSLDKVELTEDGVSFAYELDGKRTFLSPENSMAIQIALGSDIAMAFDQCLHAEADYDETARSVDLTARWAKRSVEAHNSQDQSLFGIVQGGMFGDLRKRSVEQITTLPFDGFAIGGLSVGEGPERMNAVLAETTPHMPAQYPRYLMGVGRPQDLVDGVALGVDMFDCVIPTRHARSGTLYTFQGKMRVTHSRYRGDGYPIDTSCGCYTCKTFTRAYLHHLFAVGEVLGSTLCTIHNLAFFKKLMDRARAAILEQRFAAFRRDIKDLYPEKGGAPIDEGQRSRKREAGSRQASAPAPVAEGRRAPRGRSAGPPAKRASGPKRGKSTRAGAKKRPRKS
jgi:queuine tRNA-ribosyltransferase